MTTLEKLGITEEGIYDHLFAKNGVNAGRWISKVNVWPAYSEMLEALIDTVIDYEKTGWGYSPNRMTIWKESIEKATGKTWDEICKLLETK